MDSNTKNETHTDKVVFSLEDRQSVLETPQVNGFKHENVFSAAFRVAHELLRTNSLQTTETLEPLVDALIPVSNSPCVIPEMSGVKSAPKKSILYRTISQNDSEKQEALKAKENLNENKNMWNSHEILRNVHTILYEPKQVENKIEEKYLGITHQIISEIGRQTNNNEFQAKRIKSDFSLSFEKAKTEFMNDSLIKPESVLSNSTSSSFDDMVSSSDQLDERKIKRKRSIELNTEERKNQIRSSNREAARRCRERKRKYIDFLEAKIRELENKNEELTKENIELKKKSDIKIFNQSSQGQVNPIPIILNVPTSTHLLQDKNFQDNQNSNHIHKMYQMLIKNNQLINDSNEINKETNVPFKL